jgi:hypothetical protein
MTKNFFFILLIFVFACSKPNKPKSTITNALEICMDTLDNQTKWDYFTKGYRDTCLVNGQHFAIKMIDTTGGKAILEKKINGTWQVIDSIDYGQYAYDFKEDYNKDGYQDFIEKSKWYDNVFLYDARNQTFVRTGQFYTDSKEDNILIDAEQQIYADRWSFKFEDGCSYLYQLKDLKRTNLAKMEYVSQEKGNMIENAKKRTIEVTKVTPDNLPSKTLEVLRNPKGFDASDYPYADYWKINWKKFVGK